MLSSRSSSSRSSSSRSSASNFSGAKKSGGGVLSLSSRGKQKQKQNQIVDNPKDKAKHTKTRTKTTGGDGILGTAVVGATISPPLKLISLAVPSGKGLVNKINPHLISTPNTRIQWGIAYLPMHLLKAANPDAYNYAAALVLAYKLLFNITSDKQPFADVDDRNDSIHFLETSILCMVLANPKHTRSKPLKTVLPLFEKSMDRLFGSYLYEDVPKPFSWKYYEDNKSPDETLKHAQKVMAEREAYKQLLVNMHAHLSLAMNYGGNGSNKVMTEAKVLVNSDDSIRLRPVALCEASVLNLAARLQLERRVFPQMPQKWTDDAKGISSTVYHVLVRHILSSYMYVA